MLIMISCIVGWVIHCRNLNVLNTIDKIDGKYKVTFFKSTSKGSWMVTL